MKKFVVKYALQQFCKNINNLLSGKCTACINRVSRIENLAIAFAKKKQKIGKYLGNNVDKIVKNSDYVVNICNTKENTAVCAAPNIDYNYDEETDCDIDDVEITDFEYNYDVDDFEMTDCDVPNFDYDDEADDLHFSILTIVENLLFKTSLMISNKKHLQIFLFFNCLLNDAYVSFVNP